MYKRILVPLDGSDCAAEGLRHAIGLARESGAVLVLFHAVDHYDPLPLEAAISVSFEAVRAGQREGGELLLTQALDGVQHAGVQFEKRLVELDTGRVADAIAREASASNCDLIVIGSHGRRGLSHLVMGSTAELLIRLATLPVLVVTSRTRGAVPAH